MYTVHRATGFALLLLVCNFAYGAGVTANCGSVVSTGDTAASCSTYPDSGTYWVQGVSAYGKVTLTVAANASDYTTLVTHQGVQATEGAPLPGEALGTGSGGSTSTIAYSQSLITAGSARDGYLQISPSSNADVARPYDASAAGISFGLDITPFDGQFFTGAPFTSIRCGGADSCSPGPTYYTDHYPLIPVTLGSGFNVFANGTVGAYVNRGDGISGGGVDSTFQFRFLEADGTTPVQVAAAAPEPGTIGMLGGGLLLAGLYKKWRVKAARF